MAEKKLKWKEASAKIPFFPNFTKAFGLYKDTSLGPLPETWKTPVQKRGPELKLHLFLAKCVPFSND